MVFYHIVLYGYCHRWGGVQCLNAQERKTLAGSFLPDALEGSLGDMIRNRCVFCNLVRIVGKRPL